MEKMTKFHVFTAIGLALLTALTNSQEEQDVDFFQAFHISDLHLDSHYSTNGQLKYRCHTSHETATNNTKISGGTMDDPNVDDLGPAGSYPCDPPVILFESALRKMKSLSSDPDFIVWTGDSNPHWEIDPNFDYIFSNLKNITEMISTYFPNTPVIPALGNHDTAPANQYPDTTLPDGSHFSRFYSRYIEEGSWGDFIPTEARQTFKICGYYSRSLEIKGVKFKFLVLNTNLYANNRMELDSDDPCGQLSWLEKQFDDSGEDEHVIVMAHIPPGFFERDVHRREMFNIANADNITNRFLDIVTSPSAAKKTICHMYGHTHTDSFRLLQNPYSNLVQQQIAFVAPSITPNLYIGGEAHGVNPSLRLMQYDSSNRRFADYSQFLLPLDEIPLSFIQDEESGKRDERSADRENDRRTRNSKLLDIESKDEGEDLENTTNSALIDEDEEADNATSTTTTEAVVTSTTETAMTDEKPDVISDKNYLLGKLDKYWRWSYNATEALAVENLGVFQMTGAWYVMKDGYDQKVFQDFYLHNTAEHRKPGGESCDRTCHREMMCAIVSYNSSSLRECVDRLANVRPISSTTTTSPRTTTTTEAEDPFIFTTKSMTTTQEETFHSFSTSSSTKAVERTTEIPFVSDNAVGAEDEANLSVAYGVGIGLLVIAVISLAVIGLMVHRKITRNRYRAQEFLLTDNVFRYDGYSQVEEFS